MIYLKDSKWKSLHGGYRSSYDASIPLSALEHSETPEILWQELWNGLHHQGDVGEASYASVPILVDMYTRRDLIDWNLFAIAAVIETCRNESQNPPLPDWLESDYLHAWDKLFHFGLCALSRTDDKHVLYAIISVISLHKGLDKLGKLVADCSEDELGELYTRHFTTGNGDV